MKYYIVRLKHDHGIINIRICAQDMRTAIDLVKIAENCPEGAIRSVRRVMREFKKGA
jgi:hypothetical protein